MFLATVEKFLNSVFALQCWLNRTGRTSVIQPHISKSDGWFIHGTEGVQASLRSLVRVNNPLDSRKLSLLAVSREEGPLLHRRPTDKIRYVELFITCRRLMNDRIIFELDSIIYCALFHWFGLKYSPNKSGLVYAIMLKDYIWIIDWCVYVRRWKIPKWSSVKVHEPFNHQLKIINNDFLIELVNLDAFSRAVYKIYLCYLMVQVAFAKLVTLKCWIRNRNCYLCPRIESSYCVGFCADNFF